MSEWVLDAMRVNRQYEDIGLTAEDAIQLSAAFRLYGFWRIDLDAGHVFMSPDTCRIFGMEPTERPVDLLAVSTRIHPDDIEMLMHTYERASAQRLSYHHIYRVQTSAGDYKYVRSVGKFRDKPDCGGEVVGITYEFFARRSGATFLVGDDEEG